MEIFSLAGVNMSGLIKNQHWFLLGKYGASVCYMLLRGGGGETQFNWVYVEHIAAGTVLNLSADDQKQQVPW